MKSWMHTLLRLVAVAFLVLTALYCLLAFLPYTFNAFVQAPPQAWILVFAKYHPLFCWLAFACLLAGNWRHRFARTFPLGIAPAAILVVWETFHPFVRLLENDVWSLVSGCAVLGVIVLAQLPAMECTWPQAHEAAPPSFPLGGAFTWGLLTAVLGVSGAVLRFSSAPHSIASFHNIVDLTLWSIGTHLTLALTLACGMNLLLSLVNRSAAPRMYSTAAALFLGWAGLLWGTISALANMLSFRGPAAFTYGGLLSLGLVLTTCASILEVANSVSPATVTINRLVPLVVGASLAFLAIVLPSWIGDFDWNGLFLHTFTLVLWSGLGALIWLLWKRTPRLSYPALFCVLVVTGSAYGGLKVTEIFWSNRLGKTDGDIQESLQRYATQDPSFQLAHYALGNGPIEEPCGELCRLLRQYTNVRQTHTDAIVDLQSPFIRPVAQPPNIFILVIDSMRPDYLGAYNPRVDFTPNMDALATDSVVFRNAYTQYAGTTLSEPAIWSGAMLLHAHYLQPFPRLNSLEKLARGDDYQMYVTDDTVLRKLLSADDHLTQLDANTLWNHVDLCQTNSEFFGLLDKSRDAGPIFLYSQPLNVHQFANNSHPNARQNGWSRAGFNARISNSVHQVDECIGQFVANLKARNFYENSIIVLTSDHGEATGELGRSLHAEIVYPEVMHVPLVVHLPKAMRDAWTWNTNELATLTDIAPSLYALAGHENLLSHPLFGHSLFGHSQQELQAHARHELFLASDTRAAYGILAQDGRYFYATYDSPARSYLYDLSADPEGTRDVLTPELKRAYDRRILEYLREIADFYGYKAGLRSLIAAQ